jgi:hypothetical protein
MFGFSIAIATIRILVTTFALSGLVQLAGPRFVRDAYARWEYPRGYYRITGTLELLAATLLAVPATRIRGAVLACIIMFGAVVTLLHHREYLHAVPAMALFVAAALAATLIAGAEW